MKFNVHGVLAFLVTTVGVASSPAVLGILPPKAAAVVAGLGILYQAFSKPVAQAAPPSSP